MVDPLADPDPVVTPDDDPVVTPDDDPLADPDPIVDPDPVVTPGPAVTTAGPSPPPPPTKSPPPPPPPPGGSGPGTTPTIPKPTPPVTKIPLGDFKGVHVKLQPGVNPSRVQWKQGKVYRNVDLATGATETTRIPVGKGVRPGTTPEQTLKIIETSQAKPKVRRVDIGKTIAVVTKNKITYYAEAGPPVRGYELAAKKPKRSKRGLYL